MRLRQDSGTTIIRDGTDGHKRPPGFLCNSLLGASYDTLLFLTYSRVCSEAAKYEQKHRVPGDEA